MRNAALFGIQKARGQKQSTQPTGEGKVEPIKKHAIFTHLSREEIPSFSTGAAPGYDRSFSSTASSRVVFQKIATPMSSKLFGFWQHAMTPIGCRLCRLVQMELIVGNCDEEVRSREPRSQHQSINTTTVASLSQCLLISCWSHLLMSWHVSLRAFLSCRVHSCFAAMGEVSSCGVMNRLVVSDVMSPHVSFVSGVSLPRCVSRHVVRCHVLSLLLLWRAPCQASASPLKCLAARRVA